METGTVKTLYRVVLYFTLRSPVKHENWSKTELPRQQETTKTLVLVQNSQSVVVSRVSVVSETSASESAINSAVTQPLRTTDCPVYVPIKYELD